jgi:bacteriorhodopsin
MFLALQVFFGSWLLFPILFLLGPEGFGHLPPWVSIIAHTFADMLSKNLWGLLAHALRNKVRLQLADCSSA